jgi:hypothetical protein
MTMKKERPLTDKQRECLIAAEDTLYGDTKLIPGFGRSISGLRKRGLVEGDLPHVYLTPAGKAEVRGLLGERPIVAVKMGDFAEIIGEDAPAAAKALDVTLTASRAGQPMVGVPVHCAAQWFPELASKLGRTVQFGDERYPPVAA